MRFLDIEQPLFYKSIHHFDFFPKEKYPAFFAKENQLLFVTKGVLRFTENHRKITVKAGEYFIQKQNFFYNGEHPCHTPYFFAVSFQGEWLTGQKGLPHRGTFSMDDTVPLLENLFASERSCVPYTKTGAVFLQLIEQLIPQEKPSPVQKIAATIHADPASEFSLDAISAQYGISKNHIINLFKKEYQMTPIAYLNQARLEKAENLLKTTILSLTEVAKISGFHDYSHFYRTFKKIYFCSPEEWRCKKRRKM